MFTICLAIWGAVLSTIIAILNVWTWYHNKTRVAVKVEAYDNFGTDEIGGIRFEIRNRGGKVTTIEEIILVKYLDGFWGLLRHYENAENASVKYRKTVKLPVVLQLGEVWKGYAPFPEEKSFMEMDKAALIERGRLFYKIQCAHTDRLMSGRVRPEKIEMCL
jgi:hypothetical protein